MRCSRKTTQFASELIVQRNPSQQKGQDKRSLTSEKMNSQKIRPMWCFLRNWNRRRIPEKGKRNKQPLKDFTTRSLIECQKSVCILQCYGDNWPIRNNISRINRYLLTAGTFLHLGIDYNYQPARSYDCFMLLPTYVLTGWRNLSR